MHFVKFSITLTLCICLTNALGIYKLLNSNRFFLKELNKTLGLFEAISKTKTNLIQQPLDHFDENDTRTFYMRYFKNMEFWKFGGPIYLYINGESEGSDAFLKTGVLYELAKETKGAMYASEHRYYGKSKPFQNFTTNNLAYLTSRQAIADIAKLLKNIKILPKYCASKVVVVGGSYAGNLAAWLKLLYPELVDAAIASSAPVLAKKNFYEYLESVSDDFEQYGTPGCHDTIRKVFKRYDKLFETDAGIRQLMEEEEICNNTNISKPENKQLFFLSKIGDFMYEAQYGNIESIKNYCVKINNTLRVPSSKDTESDVWSPKNDCFNYDFDDMIEGTRKVDWIMAWIYQTCNEFGYFMTTSSAKHPFTDNVPIEFFYIMCYKLYSEKFNEENIEKQIGNTNDLYGGRELNVTKVVFVNGELDPWARLGILEDISHDAPAKIIPQSSHCRDLFSNKADDPEELKEARKHIKYLIKNWIGAQKGIKNLSSSFSGCLQ